MASQGPLSPGTLVNVTQFGWFWDTPAEAATQNDVNAFVSLPLPNDTSDLLRVTNFGFDIPTGAPINGVLVEFDVNSEQSICADHEVYLVKAGVRAGDNKAVGIADPWALLDTDIYHSRGGASDLWGTSLSVADVEDSGFGVELAAKNFDEISDKTAAVDHIRMTVYYTGDVVSFPFRPLPLVKP